MIRSHSALNSGVRKSSSSVVRMPQIGLQLLVADHQLLAALHSVNSTAKLILVHFGCHCEHPINFFLISCDFPEQFFLSLKILNNIVIKSVLWK